MVDAGSASALSSARSSWPLHRSGPVTVLGLLLLLAFVVIAPAPRAAAAPAARPAASMPVAPPADPQLSNLGYGITNPTGIATGPDGNLWFVNAGVQGVPGTSSWWISRSTPTGSITNFPELGFAPGRGITTGPDGNLWFGGEGTVARMTTTGVLTTFTDPGIGFVQDITSGPDGALWFVDDANDIVGRVTTSGSMTTFPAGDIDAPSRIITGPDGNLWFGSTVTRRIGRMSPTGGFTSFPLTSKASELVAGPDGNIWYTGEGITAKMTPAGVSTQVQTIHNVATGIAFGSDGNLWLPVEDARFARVTPAGVVTYFPWTLGRDGYEHVNGVTLGPDGSVWYTLSGNAIGSMAVSGSSSAYRGVLVDGPDNMMAAPDGSMVFVNKTGASFGRVGATGDITRADTSGPFPLYNVTRSTVADGDIWFIRDGGVAKMAGDGTYTFVASLPSELGSTTGMTTGADGALWFSMAYYWSPFDPQNRPTTFSIVRMTLQGSTQVFHDALLSAPREIIAGPDGNLWFVNNDNGVARMTPTGEVAAYAVPGVTKIERLASGPDGNVWFTTGAGATIGRTTTAGVTTLFPTGSLTPQAISAGPDGNLWFTSWPNDAVGRITPDGVVTGFTDPSIDHATTIAAGSDGGVYFTNWGNNSIGRVAFAPAPPTGVTASAGTTAAAVSWTVGATGGSPLTGYVATASPGGATCASSGAPTCTVHGLVPGTEYTFRVTATNAVGTSAPSAPSAPVVVGRGSGYHPLSPARILDSRTTTGSWGGPLLAANPRELQVSGAGGVPDGAGAVVMNVTATAGTANSFVTAWPTGDAQPTASNLNFGVGETIPNLVTVKLGGSGKVSFANAVGAVDLVADVVGYYDDGIGPGDLFTAITPTRLLDSRGATGGWGAPLAAGAPQDLVVRPPGAGSAVPPSATAVVVNVTATGASAGSFLSVGPSGEASPGVSNLNFGAGQTIPNLAIVKIGDNGSIRFANAVGAVDVVVDVTGYFEAAAGTRFHPISPTRVLDGRVGTGLDGRWGAGQSRELPLAGAAGTNVDADATSVVLNVTATGATQGSFITAYPGGANWPRSSNLNFGAGQTIPNLVMTGVGGGGAVAFGNAKGSVDLVADAVGWFGPT